MSVVLDKMGMLEEDDEKAGSDDGSEKDFEATNSLLPELLRVFFWQQMAS